MNIKLTLLTAACALALSACGDKSPPPAAPAATPPAVSAETVPADTAPPTTETTPTGATKAPAKGGKAAVVTDCATEIEGNDALQYNVNSITVPSSCTDFKITLKHVGKMPVAAMGHNVVITKFADMQKVVADGMKAGLAENYVKPGDDRVIAHTNMIGGGETTSVSFPVSKIQGDGPYEFFCNFPGHAALMKGTIVVE
ncbi:MAG: azurin [Dokdonella sp.]